MKVRKAKRQLLVTVPGRWYLGLTIALGVVAIGAANNVLYLIESFLLGGLVLSGVISEKSISKIQIKKIARKAIAGQVVSDEYEVKNGGWLPVYCLEIGEWKKGHFESHAFVPFIGSKKKVRFRSQQCLKDRGRYHWEGLACATQFPFGFARKVRWIEKKGDRVVWPKVSVDQASMSLSEQEAKMSNQQSKLQKRMGSGSFSDGEIRSLLPGDDYRKVVWTVSAHREDPLVRVRKGEDSVREAIIDLRTPPGPEFEKLISRSAAIYYEGLRNPDGTYGMSSLTLISSQGKKKYNGDQKCLEALALAKAEGV